MNRETKYRIWDKKEKCWFVNSEKLELFINSDGILCGFSYDIERGWKEENIDENRFDISWFIDFTDKNGKEIYEEDVVYLKIGNRVGKVIGNIYENPELLSEDKMKGGEKMTKNNTGEENSGDSNSGDSNSGYCNSGDSNSGYWNSGDWNSGNWNSGNCNSGTFNTDEPTIRMFNKSTGLYWEDISFPSYMDFDLCEWVNENKMTDEEKEKYPEYKVTGGYLKTYEYKEAWQKAWDEASDEEKQKTLELPNFDADIFEEITGINVREWQNGEEKMVGLSNGSKVSEKTIKEALRFLAEHKG
jgi:hypothetical protein